MSDLKNFKNNSPSQSYGAVLLNPCFYSVLLYRVSNFFYRYKLSIIAKIIWFINRILFSVDIDYRAQIGKNFIIKHGLGIVIGCDVIIHDNVTIYHGVTLGGTGKVRVENGKTFTQPIIYKGTTIYTNTCIFGPVIINKNSEIKACQTITQDFF